MNGKSYGRSILGWYGQPCTNNETGKITVAPYKAGKVNHATNNETAKNTVDPYQAGIVNHTTINETVKITDTILIWHMHCIYRQRLIKNYVFGQKDAM